MTILTDGALASWTDAEIRTEGTDGTQHSDDFRPTMRDQETQTSDVLCFSQGEFVLQMDEWAAGFTKRLVEEGVGPMSVAVSDLERGAQQHDTVREETRRRLRDALELI